MRRDMKTTGMKRDNPRQNRSATAFYATSQCRNQFKEDRDRNSNHTAIFSFHSLTIIWD